MKPIGYGLARHIIQVQQQLAAQGITERLDILTLIAGPGMSTIDFGMLSTRVEHG